MIAVEEHPTVIRVMDGERCIAEASKHGALWACTASGEDTVWVAGRQDAESWIRTVYLAAGGTP